MGVWEHGSMGTREHDIARATDVTHDTTRQLWAGDWPRGGVPWPGAGPVEGVSRE
jgi:hypothetical protein